MRLAINVVRAEIVMLRVNAFAATLLLLMVPICSRICESSRCGSSLTPPNASRCHDAGINGAGNQGIFATDSGTRCAVSELPATLVDEVRAKFMLGLAHASRCQSFWVGTTYIAASQDQFAWRSRGDFAQVADPLKGTPGALKPKHALRI